MARYKGENRAWEGAARLLANPARGREGVRDPQARAEIGGWSLRQVQKWCADGTLPAMMIGGTWAISGQKICDMLGIED